MTEQQESQVKPQPTAAVNGSKSRSGAVLGGVAILLALGLTPAQAKSTLRLTLDAANTTEEIDTAAAVITACVQRLRDGVR